MVELCSVGQNSLLGSLILPFWYQFPVSFSPLLKPLHAQPILSWQCLLGAVQAHFTLHRFCEKIPIWPDCSLSMARITQSFYCWIHLLCSSVHLCFMHFYMCCFPVKSVFFLNFLCFHILFCQDKDKWFSADLPCFIIPLNVMFHQNSRVPVCDNGVNTGLSLLHLQCLPAPPRLPMQTP